MKKQIIFLLLAISVTPLLHGQSFMASSQAMLSMHYIHSNQRYEGTYSFMDIQGDVQYATDTAVYTANTFMPCAFLSSSLFNTGDSKFFIGDFESFSMGLGYTSNNVDFKKASYKDKAMAGQLGLALGLTLGWNISEDYEIGVRYYYDFQWWIINVGDNNGEMAPFTNNLQYLARWKNIQADLTLGGRMKHYNSRVNMRYTTFNLRKLISDDKDRYIGLRLDFFNDIQLPYVIQFKKSLSSVGFTYGWLF